jgi:nucleoside-diphosphate-sugar epimerase
MIFFVAGSTGYTGQSIVQHLRQRKLNCIAHIRPNSKSGEQLRPQFEKYGAVIDDSSWEQAAIEKAILEHQPTHIFSLLGTTQRRNKANQKSGQETSYSSVDRDLTLMLYQAASQLPNKPVFVYLSSLGADKPTGSYMRARFEVEQVILQGELPYVIARPGFISGPDRDEFRPAERFAAITSDSILKGLAFMGWNSPNDQYSSLSASQLAEGLIENALNNPSSIVYSRDLRPQ